MPLIWYDSKVITVLKQLKAQIPYDRLNRWIRELRDPLKFSNKKTP